MGKTYVFCMVCKCKGIKWGTIVRFITLGHPSCEITLSRTGITVEAEVDLTISTTAYRECSSMITNRYCPVRKRSAEVNT